MRKRDERRNRKAGFTLVEILLVIALITLLAGVSIVAVNSILGDNEQKIAKFKVEETFKTPLFRYRMDMGSFPSTEVGLKALYSKPANDRGRWKGPYIEKQDDILDPWGHELKYRFPSTNNPGGYDLYSLGPDGVESDDDIKNW